MYRILPADSWQLGVLVMNIFFWIVAILLVGMGGFTGYTNWKAYMEARRARKQFLETHKDAETVKVGTVRVWMYAAMLVACILLAIMIFVMPASTPEMDQNRIAQALVYVGLAVFAFAMLGEGLMDEILIATPDGFLFESDVIRFKNVRGVSAGKGWFKSSFINLMGGKEIPVSKKTAKWVEEHLETWKKTRKETFRTRKERRAAARRERASK